ncbi:MAG: ribbon-helix-helix protein, CopG family [Chloroflexi bacterium]|nr:ribbon-helix-helix protein, CopG family [Chloroflexota bacterium]
MSTVLTSTSQKITVTLPKRLLERLDERVTTRGRSRFIAEAIEDRLALQEQVAVLEETAGAWSDVNHPDMNSGEAIDQWIDGLRASWSYTGD